MSWSILLSNYQKSILSDSFHVIVLAVLERNGIATEEELVNQIGGDRTKVLNALLDLYSNRMIEYGRHSIKISLQGKGLIDRFDIHRSIVADVVDTFSLEAEHKGLFLPLLEKYRAESFLNYLNTLSSIKVLDSLWSLINKDQTSGEITIRERNLGCTALVARDLKNWLVHSSPTDEWEKALSLSIVTELQSRSHLRLEAQSEERATPFWQLTKTFHNYQISHDKDVWFDEWSDRCLAMQNLLRTTDQKRRIMALMAYIGNDANHSKRSQNNEQFRWWIKSGPRFSEQFLEKMMASSSLSELEIATGISQLALRQELSAIQGQTKKLLEEVAPAPSPSPSHSPKILFVAANPSNLAPLQLEEEIRLIAQRIRPREYRKMFSLQSAPALRATDFAQKLMEQTPDIVHFSGHGSSGTGLLFLGDGDHAAKPIPEGELAQIFGRLGNTVKCVVLDACYSEIQAAAIAESIPCVVGVSRAVSDRTAIAFATEFYEALASGKSVAAAFKLGKVQVELAHPASADTAQIPKLLVRSGVDAKQVFLVAAPPRSSDAAELRRDQRTSRPPAVSRSQRVGNLTIGGLGNGVRPGQHSGVTDAGGASEEDADIHREGEENHIVVDQKDA